MIPNLIIFRIEPILGDNILFEFAEFDYIDGKLSKNGTPFALRHHDDSYNSMGYDHIVLAERTKEGSRDLARYSLKNDDTNELAKVYEIDDLPNLVDHLIETYKKSHSN